MMRLDPRAQLSTLVGFGLEIFGDGVELLIHCAYSNIGKQLDI